MEKWLIYAGSALLASFASYGLYSSVSTALHDPTPANLTSTLLMLGMVLTIAATALQRNLQKTLRRWLLCLGSALVALFVCYGLYTNAQSLLESPSLGAAFSTFGMLGLLLVLGGTVAQRARA